MVIEDKESQEKELFAECNTELRRLYDYVAHSFEHVRNKALALLVGEVAVVTFLFSGGGFNGILANSQPAYGTVIYGLGIALLIYAFVMYFSVVSTIQWPFPTEEPDMKNPSAKFKNNPLEFQKYLHAEYMSKVPQCIVKVRQRSLWFMRGTYALAVGVFLIILVRYGGGA